MRLWHCQSLGLGLRLRPCLPRLWHCLSLGLICCLSLGLVCRPHLCCLSH